MRKWLAILGVLVFGLNAGCSTMRGGKFDSASILPSTVAGVSVRNAGDTMLVRRVHLDADAETVFAFLTDFENMPEWMPGLSRVTVDHGQSQNGPQQCGSGSVRTCYAKGMELNERVIRYERPRLFAVELTEASSMAPLRKGTGVVEIESVASGGCDVTYSVVYATKSLHPMGPLVPHMFRKQLTTGLDNVIVRFGGHRLP